MKWFVLSLSLLWCLVEVASQNMRSYPNVTFMDETLANHSYVDFNLVGNDTIQCHTDLSTCCSGAQGMETGISLMELDCHSLVVMSLLERVVELR